MKPLDHYLETRQRLFDEIGIQPQSIFITTSGPVRKVHFLKAGSGRPLILLHGGGSYCMEWINILPQLARHYEVHLVDRPGCGQTDYFNYKGVDVEQHAVDFIRSFMDATNLQKASFLAQSMGGYFTLCFALHLPSRVDNLVLIGAPAGISRWVPLPLRLMGTPILNQILAKTIFKPSPKSVSGLYKNLFVHDVSKVPQTYLNNTYYNQVLPGNMSSFFSLLRNRLSIVGWKKRLLLTPRLKQLKVAVGFIWGANDVFEKPETGLPKAQTIPQHRFVIVENAGHCPWIDQPQECVRLILEMLKEPASPNSGETFVAKTFAGTE